MESEKRIAQLEAENRRLREAGMMEFRRYQQTLRDLIQWGEKSATGYLGDAWRHELQNAVPMGRSDAALAADSAAEPAADGAQ